MTLSISSVIPNTYAVITGEILCYHASLLDNDIVGVAHAGEMKHEDDELSQGCIEV